MQDQRKEQIVGILGLGLDEDDGHMRVTRGDNFSVYMGSENTHERMTETCIKINEKLDHRSARLKDLTREEFLDLLSEID